MLHNIFGPAEEYYNKIVGNEVLSVSLDQKMLEQEIWSTLFAFSMELRFDFKLFKATVYRGLNKLEDRIAFLGGEVNIWRALANVYKGMLNLPWNIKNFYDQTAKEVRIGNARGLDYIIDGEQYKCKEDEIIIFPSSAMFVRV